MKLIDTSISINELKQIASHGFGNFVKVVVDIQKRIMVIDASLHADEEAMLLEHGSSQKNLWGINLYTEKYNSSDFIEYDSMINLRPQDNNISRNVNDEKTRSIIQIMVYELVTA
jgi:hypothetical protein